MKAKLGYRSEQTLEAHETLIGILVKTNQSGEAIAQAGLFALEMEWEVGYGKGRRKEEKERKEIHVKFSQTNEGEDSYFSDENLETQENE